MDTDPISFGIIAEGATDQKVIKHILEGVFGKEGDTIRVSFIQPPNDETMRAGEDPPPGGWTLVFDFLESGAHFDAAAFNDVLIVQIDTDVSTEPGFGVPHQDDVDALCEAVQKRLERAMGEPFEDMVFAVSVHALECWLLPLLVKQPAKRSKLTGCLEAANSALRRKNKPLLSDGSGKDPRVYANVSKPYRKPKQLDKLACDNPSLGLFVDALKALKDRPDITERLEALRAQRGL